MALSGIKHVDVGTELSKSEWESEANHEIVHGNAFPTDPAPVERQLFYRDDLHAFYIHDGTRWGLKLKDADADTKISVEDTADDDTIHMYNAAVETFLLSSLGVLTLPKQSGCKAYLTASQTTARGSYQKINLNGTIYDIQTEFNTGTYKFIAKTAGLYIIVATATVLSLPDASECDLLIYRNGVAAQASVALTGVLGNLSPQVVYVGSLAVTDYIELYIYMSGAGNLTVYLGEKNTNLYVAKIG